MASQFLSVIRAWAGMAWADGVIAPNEAEALRRLIGAAGELSDDERRTALGFLENKVAVDEAGLATLSREARAGVYLAAARLAGIDRHVADEERTYLGHLRRALGLADDEANKIEQQAFKK